MLSLQVKFLPHFYQSFNRLYLRSCDSRNLLTLTGCLVGNFQSSESFATVIQTQGLHNSTKGNKPKQFSVPQIRAKPLETSFNRAIGTFKFFREQLRTMASIIVERGNKPEMWLFKTFCINFPCWFLITENWSLG